MSSVIVDYILQCPEQRQKSLQEIYDIIRNEVPDGTIEKISWGMPTFSYNGNLVHFACQKNHIGFYPGASGVEHFQQLLNDYHFSKGAIQFPYHKELPKELIRQIVRFRIKENES